MSDLSPTKNKFTVSNHRAGNVFAETHFFQWSTNNHYRTSSHDMNTLRVSHLYGLFSSEARSQKVHCDPPLRWLQAPHPSG